MTFFAACICFINGPFVVGINIFDSFELLHFISDDLSSGAKILKLPATLSMVLFILVTIWQQTAVTFTCDL